MKYSFSNLSCGGEPGAGKNATRNGIPKNPLGRFFFAADAIAKNSQSIIF
jgi:hypothetical protein